MKDSRLVQDVFSNDQMVIVEKYEDFLNYVYPIVLNMPRRPGAWYWFTNPCALRFGDESGKAARARESVDCIVGCGLKPLKRSLK